MYKLKLKKGSKVTITKRGQFKRTLIGGEEYSQELLEQLYKDGHTTIVSKTKDKQDAPNTDI